LFAKFPPALPEDDDIWCMGEQGVTLLEQHGFTRYEVSAFGKIPSKHNLNYWKFGDYIGIGAGAHGKITDINTGKILRTRKAKSPKDYVNNPVGIIEQVENLSFEFMLNALRLKQGFEPDLFEHHTGKSISIIKNQLSQAEDLGLLVINNKKIRSSEKGYNFLNDLIERFL
jgi:oxygen-independent coproporphyrinogen-3 oxidase